MRNRRVDHALQTNSRLIWAVTAAILVLGLIAVVWATSPSERRRRGVMERLELGDSTSRVVALLGEPDARCPGTELAHLQAGFPPGWPTASQEAALQRLGAETAERWVYPVSGRRRAGCSPRDGQTELGVTPSGRVLWYVAVTGKTQLRLPDNYAPAGVVSLRRVP